MRVLSTVNNLDESEIHSGFILHVLKVFSRPRNEEVFSLKRRSFEACRYRPQYAVDIAILRDFGLVQQKRDVTAVTFVPAVSVHIGGRPNHLDNKRGCKYIFHGRLPSLAEYVSFVLLYLCEPLTIERLSADTAVFFPDITERHGL